LRVRFSDHGLFHLAVTARFLDDVTAVKVNAGLTDTL